MVPCWLFRIQFRQLMVAWRHCRQLRVHDPLPGSLQAETHTSSRSTRVCSEHTQNEHTPRIVLSCVYVWRLYFECLLVSVFSPARYRLVKITRFCSEVVLRSIKHTTVYPGSGPFLKVIVLRLAVWYWRWIVVTMGWVESSRSSLSEEQKCSCTSSLKGRGHFIDR
jgi:hypothetical protein